MKIPRFESEAVVSDIIDLELPDSVYIIREMWGNQEFVKNQCMAIFKLIFNYSIKNILSEAIFENRNSAQLFGAIEIEKAGQLAAMSQIKPIEFMAVTTECDFSILAGDDSNLYEKQNAAMLASMELAKEVSVLVQQIKEALLPVLKNGLDNRILSFIEVITDSKHLTRNISTLFADLVSYCAEKDIELTNELDNLQQLMDMEQNSHMHLNRAVTEINELKAKVIEALENDDPEEEIVENILTIGLSRIVYMGKKFKIEDFLNQNDDTVYQFYLKTAHSFKDELIKVEELLGADSLEYARMLIDLAQCLKIDYSSSNITSFIKYSISIKNLKENFVEQLDIIKQFQKQLIRKSLNDGFKTSILNFLVNLTNVDLMAKNQLSAIEQKYTQKLLFLNSNRVSELLYKFDVNVKVINEFERKADVWDMVLERTKRFYHFSRMREDVMIDIVKSNILNTKNENQNYLFCMGGFHSDYVQRELSRQKIANSLCITPQKGGINHNEVEKAYYDLFKS